MLKELKERLKESTPAENVKEYSIDWSDDEGINDTDHKEYLVKFCEDFWVEVKRLIDSAAEAEDPTTKVSWHLGLSGAIYSVGILCVFNC